MCRTVVLVDDEAGVLLALKLVMQSMGYRVHDFSSPTKAIQFIKESDDYDFILSDIKMPELSGIQVLEEVRNFSPTVPFILMSGHARGPEVDRAMQMGASGFLSKPFSPDDLNDIIAGIELSSPFPLGKAAPD